MRIFPLTGADSADWLDLRIALWPGTSRDEHLSEIAAMIDAGADKLNLVARDEHGTALGFVEAGLRRDYVNGTDTSPVAFLEGIFVVPEARGRGVARALVAATGTWAREQGCTEFASDADIGNIGSHAMHLSLGFEETQRVVFFRKMLR